MDDLDRLDDAFGELDTTLGGAAQMAASFKTELTRIHETFDAAGRGAQRFESALSRGVSRAIDGVVLDGRKLSDALGDVAQSLVDTAWRAAVRPVADHVGGAITGAVSGLFGQYAPFANGAGFVQGRVMPFAQGGIVSSPTAFPMRGGTGLMGEAGPEAIMPLARGPDGKLGVRAQAGGQPVTVVMNISTPDVQGFRRSQSQIAAEMGRALSRGSRNR
ncbi:phage tail tape measure protein [Litorisediminicola beolgyonensis]|uniref:Phage tail tape measure protein n=1 Tax=Litorisediminicola beolgyonensis TaxID=1173614 RepID=A0ABW3ZNX2_9RHOB